MPATRSSHQDPELQVLLQKGLRSLATAASASESAVMSGSLKIRSIVSEPVTAIRWAEQDAKRVEAAIMNELRSARA
jgi:hypothetical protein